MADDNTQPQPWQKVGVEEVRGPNGMVTMAQVYVPNQGFGQNLYGPEWLIDRIIADHAAATKLAERDAETDALAQALEKRCLGCRCNATLFDSRQVQPNSGAMWHLDKDGLRWMHCELSDEERAALAAYRERKAREGLIPLDERRHV